MPQDSPTIALVTNRVQGDSSYERLVWEGAQAGAHAAGVRLISLSLGIPDRDESGRLRASTLFDLIGKSDADGFLVTASTMGNAIGHEGIAEIFRLFGNRPAVGVAHEVEGHGLVGVDNGQGMRAIVQHVAGALGRRRIAYVSGPLSNPEAVERLGAYREVLREFGLAEDPKLVFEGTWLRESGAGAVRSLLEKKIPFDAVVAANDLMAFGVLSELSRQGVVIPRDVAVTGFDDDPEAAFASPPLTTVAQPLFQLGESGILSLAEAVRTGRRPGKRLLPAVPVFRRSAPQLEAAQAVRDERRGPGALVEAVQALTASSSIGWLNEFPRHLDAVMASREWTDVPVVHHVHSSSLHDLAEIDAFTSKVRPLFGSVLDGLPEWRPAFEFLHDWVCAVSERRLALTFRQSQSHELQSLNLLQANQALNATKTVADLKRTLASAAHILGVDNLTLCLYQDGVTEAKPVVIVKDGREASTGAGSFDASRLVPGGLSSLGRNVVVKPLQLENQESGYLVLDVCGVEPLVYEALGDQLAVVVNTVLLISKIQGAEEVAAAKADEIRRLVLPMLTTIEDSSRRARDQGQTIGQLNSAQRETAKQLSSTDQLVQGVKDRLEQVIRLIATIDDLSETISVIAINAAIAAARAGSDGRVFTVIATEIRTLSVETKTNTSKIAEVLAQLSDTAEGFFRANVQTKGLFQRLDDDVKSLSSSFEFLQTAMQELTSRAQTVLKTMGSNESLD